MFAGYDVIVDGTDNFPTRYLVNDACVLLGKPNVYGSIFRFDGQATVFFPPEGPCYRCLYPEPPPPDLVPNCAEGGVLGILPGLIGVVQATETVKLILGTGKPLDRPALALRRARDDLPRNEGPQEPQVPHLRAQPDDPRADRLPAILRRPRRRSPPAAASGAAIEEITPTELQALLEPKQPPLILDVRNPEEIAICRIAGSTVIPLPELPDRLGELDPSASIVVHCKSGVRSAKAIALLQAAGFSQPEEPQGRNPRLDQGSRSQPAELLARILLTHQTQTDSTSLRSLSRSQPGCAARSSP